MGAAIGKAVGDAPARPGPVDAAALVLRGRRGVGGGVQRPAGRVPVRHRGVAPRVVRADVRRGARRRTGADIVARRRAGNCRRSRSPGSPPSRWPPCRAAALSGWPGGWAACSSTAPCWRRPRPAAGDGRAAMAAPGVGWRAVRGSSRGGSRRRRRRWARDGRAAAGRPAGLGGRRALLLLAAKFALRRSPYASARPAGSSPRCCSWGRCRRRGDRPGNGRGVPARSRPYPTAFAVLGMAAWFTGSVRAPLTAIVLIVEMTGNHQQLLSLAVACLLPTWRPGPRVTVRCYEVLLEADLHRRPPPRATDARPFPRRRGRRAACRLRWRPTRVGDGGPDVPRAASRPGACRRLERAGPSPPEADTLLLPGDHLTVVVPDDEADKGRGTVVRLATGFSATREASGSNGPSLSAASKRAHSRLRGRDGHACRRPGRLHCPAAPRGLPSPTTWPVRTIRGDAPPLRPRSPRRLRRDVPRSPPTPTTTAGGSAVARAT